MGQIPTVRWTREYFENNHDDNDENNDDDDDDDDDNDENDDDDDDGLPAYSHHVKIMMMKLFLLTYLQNFD